MTPVNRANFGHAAGLGLSAVTALLAFAAYNTGSSILTLFAVVSAICFLGTGFWGSRCPYCKRFVDLRGRTRFCPRCGQQVDIESSIAVHDEPKHRCPQCGDFVKSTGARCDNSLCANYEAANKTP